MSEQVLPAHSRKWDYVLQAMLLAVAVFVVVGIFRTMKTTERQRQAEIAQEIARACAGKAMGTAEIGGAIVCADRDGRLFAVPVR
jgi:hypothetical protein